MVSGLFLCGLRLNAGRELAEILCQSSDGFPAVSFVSDTIEPGKNAGVGIRAADSRGEACDGIEANRRRAFALMGESNLHAVGKAREGYFQMRMIWRQMLKSFRTGSDDGGLQSSYGAILESGDIGHIPDHAARRSRQARVGIEEQSKCFGFSGHGWWPATRRKLPGNPGNSRDRRSKGVRCAVLCRWCSTFHRCSALPASRIARNGSDLAWCLSRKLYLSMGRRSKAKVRGVRRVLYLPFGLTE